MADDLPVEYDVIVLGTGLVEAIVAAACSRNGKKVLHVDRNMYYGGNWSTFNLRDLEEWLASNRSTELNIGGDTATDEPSNVYDVFLKEDETFLNMGSTSSCVGNVTDLDVTAIDRGLECEQTTPQQATANQSTSILPSAAAEGTANKQEDASKSDDVVEATDEYQRENASHQVTSETCDDELDQRPSVETNATEDAEADDSGRTSDLVVESNTQQTVEPVTWNAIKEDWRRFNIDLAPKFLFSRGVMVDVLIKSAVSRYLEFKAVVKFLTYFPNGTLQQVPQSRSDVFSSTSISMLEKRMLMKFLSFCLEYERNTAEYEAYSQKPFIEFLRARHLTDNLQHFVLYAIAMKTEDTSTEEGLKACQKYLQSLGRFGNTPFLWPLYGVGELPQGFCRLCAVFGGIYVLRRNVEKVVLDANNQFCAIISESKRLNASWLIGGSSYLGSCLSKSIPNIRVGSRGVFVTDKSVHPGSEEGITFLTIPPHAADSPGLVQVIELPSISFACPRHGYVVHLSCKSSGRTAKEDLEGTAELLFDFNTGSNGSKPRVLWRMYFSQTAVVASEEANACLPGNVVLTSQPNSELGFDSVVAEAKSIFERICPNEKFLPTPPDPEDIVYEPDEVESLPSGNPGHEDSKETEVRQSEDHRIEQTSDKVLVPNDEHDTDELSGFVAESHAS